MTSIIHRNGNPASPSELARVAFAGYAHFTALQVRNGAVRGLDLHLSRLRDASETLFGTHLPDADIVEHLRAAVEAGAEDSSVTLFIASQPGEFEAGSGEVSLETFARVSDPASPPAGPFSLDVVEHERDLAHVKHVGEVGKTLHLRRARARGYDDALFVTRAGLVSEATIWNAVFWDGTSVVWPRAAMLNGVTQQIVSRQLERAGIAQTTREVHIDDIDDRWSAAIMNSWTPGVAVTRIGQQSLGEASELVDTLHRSYASEQLRAA